MRGYLELKAFAKTSEYFSSSHRFIIENNGTYKIKIECLDASKFTHDTMKKLSGTVLFSATLTPLNYFKQLLSENEGEHIILPSPFDQQNMKLLFMGSTKQ